MVTELDDTRRQRLSNFLDAIASDDVTLAQERLSALSELQLDVTRERRCYDALALRLSFEVGLCREHEVCECPECFSVGQLFDCGDPIDDLEP